MIAAPAPLVLALTVALAGASAAQLHTGPAAAAPAAAPAHWGPIATLARHVPSRPDIVVDGSGTETVVWSHRGHIVAARKPAGRQWQTAVRLGDGSSPQIGLDRAGTVTVIWSRHLSGFGPQVMSARRSTTGHWTTSRAVSASAPAVSSARGAFTPDLAVSRRGAVVVTWLWNQEDSGAAQVQARYRDPRRGWLPITTLSATEAASPVAAIDASGRAVVSYVIGGTIYAARRLSDGWAGSVVLGSHAEPPQVAVDDAGDIVVAWLALGTDGWRPQAVTRPVGGAWTAPVDLAPPPVSAEPVVASGPSGTSTVAWSRTDGSVVASTRPLGGSWSAPQQVAPGGVAVRAAAPWFDLTVGRTGATLLSFTRAPDASTTYIGAAYRPAGGAWQPPTRVSPTGVQAGAAEGFVRRGDRAVLVWRGSTAQRLGLVQLRRLHP